MQIDQDREHDQVVAESCLEILLAHTLPSNAQQREKVETWIQQLQALISSSKEVQLG